MDYRGTLTEGALRRAILGQAATQPGAEVCGLVYGSQVVPVQNVSADPASQFIMSASDLLAAYNMLGEPDGIYHSHPRGTRVPSYLDTQGAMPGMRYFIAAQGEVHEYAP